MKSFINYCSSLPQQICRAINRSLTGIAPLPFPRKNPLIPPVLLPGLIAVNVVHFKNYHIQ
jgi:hypothetical protein